MNIKSQKDFASGLLFMVAGVVFAWHAADYSVGAAAHIGPGYFPLVLGMLLTVLGGVITFKALVVETVDGDRIGAIAWRPLLCIVAANLVFGAMIVGLPGIQLPPMGLVAGIYAVTVISSLGAKDFRWKEVFVLSTVLAALGYLVFVVWLQLPFPIWPIWPAWAGA